MAQGRHARLPLPRVSALAHLSKKEIQVTTPTVYVVARTRQQATAHLHLAVDHWGVFDAPRRRGRRPPTPRVVIVTPTNDPHAVAVGPGGGFAYIVGELCKGTPADADLAEATAISIVFDALTANNVHVRRLWKTA